ncbi:prolactin-releasing peptide [Prionailurus iriomotensis]
MKALQAWLLGLLLLGLALRGAASQTHPHSMEIRNPDIDPAWYASRRIRPVGRFGRRTAAPPGCRELARLLPPERRR